MSVARYNARRRLEGAFQQMANIGDIANLTQEQVAQLALEATSAAGSRSGSKGKDSQMTPGSANTPFGWGALRQGLPPVSEGLRLEDEKPVQGVAQRKKKSLLKALLSGNTIGAIDAEQNSFYHCKH